jgi:hypothetical protein
MNKQFLTRGLGLALAFSILPAVASAQTYGEQTISGTVSYFSGYNMSIDGGRSVSLHQGTIINPTGTTLQPGMNVVVHGYRNGNTFNADEVDLLGYNNGGYGNRGYGNDRRDGDRDDRDRDHRD